MLMFTTSGLSVIAATKSSKSFLIRDYFSLVVKPTLSMTPHQ